ncbi:hypothetical protein CCACVL1_08203 [Corchorus capsularis]|uniref:Uncharacterized protein n=1 Tax=Corchorus capsularis TaxID=210143 RepID=A0A1R3J1T2_COCAP|nr:hypothetical protein CCACVL1_08203 [Corchorus capsularis]
MVDRFFFMRQSDVQHQKQESDSISLLSGPPSCGKTSLLFQFAINSALECSSSNSEVVFICNRRRIETKPPYLSQGIDSSSDIFQRIKMKYVEDDDGIKKYFAAFHLHNKFPAAVIVDDFGEFFNERGCQERYGNPRGRDLAMVRTLALCHNAIIHAKLCLGCAAGDGAGSFLLKHNNYSENGSSKNTKIAKYSIAFQYLFLERISNAVE